MIFLSMLEIHLLLKIWASKHYDCTNTSPEIEKAIEELSIKDLVAYDPIEVTSGEWAGLAYKYDSCHITQRGKAWFLWRVIAFAGFLLSLLAALLA